MGIPVDGTGQRTRTRETPVRGDTGQIQDREDRSFDQMSTPAGLSSGGDTGMRTRPFDPGNDDARDGMHRTYGTGAPGETTGQTGRPAPGANVGRAAGPEMAMGVGPTKKHADTPEGT